MADEIEVDPEAMTDVVDALRGIGGGIQGDLDQRQGTLDLLVNASNGDAANAYQHAQGEWMTSMTDIRETLGLFREVLSGVTSRYEATEDAVVRMCQ
jgi:WXG100 family type VII secretion target